MALHRWLPIAFVAIIAGCVRSALHASATPPRKTIGLLPVRYPDLMRSANVQGVVILDVAVDSLGRYDRPRSRVVSETHAIFTLAVRAAIDSAARAPAIYGDGRFVGTRRDTFAFILHRDSTQACPQATDHWAPVCAVAIPPRHISIP